MPEIDVVEFEFFGDQEKAGFFYGENAAFSEPVVGFVWNEMLAVHTKFRCGVAVYTCESEKQGSKEWHLVFFFVFNVVLCDSWYFFVRAVVQDSGKKRKIFWRRILKTQEIKLVFFHILASTHYIDVSI